jgi:benzoylformate decarboxylase
MDLDQPPIDFTALATSMGVAATRVDHTADVGDALATALSSGRPQVLELPITG